MLAFQIPFSGIRSAYYSILYKIDLSPFPVEPHRPCGSIACQKTLFDKLANGEVNSSAAAAISKFRWNPADFGRKISTRGRRARRRPRASGPKPSRLSPRFSTACGAASSMWLHAFCERFPFMAQLNRGFCSACLANKNTGLPRSPRQSRKNHASGFSSSVRG